jgi:hypothetical protein
VKLKGKAIEVADMQRTKVVVEGIVEERVVYGKVVGLLLVGYALSGRRPIDGPL